MKATVSVYAGAFTTFARTLTNVSFNYVNTENPAGKNTIDPFGSFVLSWIAHDRARNMTCTNCECPFHELQAEDNRLCTAECGCMVADAVKQVKFLAGDTLFVKGQPSTSLYSVSNGLVKIISDSREGREQIVGLSVPGKLLVGLQSITDDHYEYTAVAATVVSACRIRHRALLNAVLERPDIAMRLIAAMNAQLAQSRSLMEVMGHMSASAKIASFILLMAPSPKNGGDRFTLPFSRMDLAGLLGLREETVCRQMADMKRRGVIYAPRGRMEIQDWKQLRAIADESAL